MEIIPQKIHCMGVGGVGLSGVAALFQKLGCEVSGCDEHLSESMREWLLVHGVEVADGHDVRHVEGEKRPNLVVWSPAVGEKHSELERARALGIPVIRRGEALAKICSQFNTVAICGTHGKTTTSCFSVALLREMAGDGVGWCIGGHTKTMGGGANFPEKQMPFVVEADESDGTLAHYRAKVLVVTSIDADHMEHFDSFETLKECFGKAVAAARKVVVCVENRVAREVVELKACDKVLGYGFGEEAQLRATEVETGVGKSDFTIEYEGEKWGRVTIGVPGRHNILNALGAAGACLALGMEPRRVFRALGGIWELPMRRYERHQTADGVEVISDYSHHPAEIRALIETARANCGGRLWAVFQPHRYTRTRALGADFPGAFCGVDGLVLLPVYGASEKVIAEGSRAILYRHFREANRGDATIPIPMLAKNVEQVADWVVSLRSPIREGDVILVVGAGDVVRLVGMLEQRRRKEEKERGGQDVVAWRVSFGTEVVADEIENVEEERQLRRLLEERGKSGVRILGQGSNVVVSELGVRGIVAKLNLTACEIGEETEGGDVFVKVGAGVLGAVLLARLREAGISGLEYMVGIPGTVGGWLAMNAGTRYGVIGDCVKKVVVYTANGERREESTEACGFGYRTCRLLERMIVVSVVLKMKKSTTEEVGRKMAEYRGKRFAFGAMRTAGSVFRNPEKISAGKVLEDSGLKGFCIGGAKVCERHANIIEAAENVKPSDLLALMEFMHDKVLEKTGVDLEREIQEW